MLEPEPQSEGDLAHGSGIGREVKITGAQDRPPIGDGDVIEKVLRLELEIDAASFSEADDTAEGSIEIEGGGTGDGVASGVAPEAGERECEGIGVEQGSRQADGKA